MKKILLASVFTGLMAFPAFAQMAEDTTCKDFMAMNADAQMKAIGDMSGDGMMADDMASGDNMAGDNMAGDNMASGDNMAGDDMAKDNMAGDGMMAEGPSVEAVAAACAGKPDMMLNDAMMAAGSH